MYQFWYNKTKIGLKKCRNRNHRKKFFQYVFFCEANGNEPVRKWLKSLNKEERTAIGKDICTIQEGWPLGMPLVRSLGSGLWEIRCSILSGIARVIFVMVDGQMVLLHGFIKKTQKTPTQELDVAKNRLKN